MGTRRRTILPKPLQMSQLSGARRVGLVKPALVLRGLGLLTGRVRNAQECKERWAQDPFTLRM